MTIEPEEKLPLPEEAIPFAEPRRPARRNPRPERERPRWVNRPRQTREQRIEYRRPARRLRREVGGMGLLLAGLVILFASSSSASAGVLPNLLRGLLGVLVGKLGSSVIALALMALGIAVIVGHGRFRLNAAATGLGMLFLAFLGLHQIGVPRDGIFGRIWAQEPGGVLGMLLAELLKQLVGRTWGAVVLVAVCLCAIAQITEVPLAELAQRAGRLSLMAVKVSGLWIKQHLHRRSRRLRLEKTAARTRKSEKPETKSAALVPVSPPVLKEAPCPPLAPAPEPAPPAAQAPVEEAVPADEAIIEAGETKASGYSDYVLPPLALLPHNGRKQSAGDHEDTVKKMETLEQTLSSFGIDAKVVEIERGPRVTRYEIRSPRGVRVSRITNLADDIAYSLAALDVRVEAPVPGKGVIGIEVPNAEAVFVDLLEILSSEEAQKLDSKIGFALGKDITGNPRMADLAKMPHLLIAGATNSGKSVCLNAIIASYLFRSRPDEVKLLLIDPKRVELSVFSGIPHLAAPVAHDVKEAAGLLRWAIREMEKRYEIFAELGVRNITGYNERAKIDEELEPMWFLVIVVDELADLMMQAKGEFEASICRLAQLARATGIHLVVATQRPSVNVITGTIKANISSRIAFAVASQADSRVILDMNGAERLVGSGDMLYLPIDESKPARIQGAYISEREIAKVVKHLKEQAKPHYSAEALAAEKTGSLPGQQEAMEDELFEKALEYVLSTKYASASMLQRRMRIGYTRAARLIDMMEEKGYIGPADGSKPREVFVNPSLTGGAPPPPSAQ